MIRPTVVTGASVVISQGLVGQVHVVNIGSESVYITTQPVNYGGFELRRGCSFTQDSAETLYAYSPNGTQVVVLDNGGQYNDVAASAQAIIDAGLATEIADRLRDGGVPSLDSRTRIASDEYTTGGSSHRIEDIDVSAYLSVRVMVMEHTDVDETTPLLRRVALLWHNGSGIEEARDDFYVMDDSDYPVLGSLYSYVNFTTQTRARYLTISISATARTGTTVNVEVDGSSVAVFTPEYRGRSAYAIDTADPADGMYTWNVGTKTAGTPLTDYPHVLGNKVQLSVKTNGVTANGSVSILDAEDQYYLATMPVLTTDTTYAARTMDVHLGNRPVRLYCSTALGSTGTQITLIRVP